MASSLRVCLAGQKHGHAPGEEDHCNLSLLVYPTALTIAVLFLIYICTETPHKSKPKHNFNVNRQLIHNLHEDSKYYHITGNLLQLWLFICSHLQRTRLQNIRNLSKADKSKINISYLCHSIESQVNISTTEKFQISQKTEDRKPQY